MKIILDNREHLLYDKIQGILFTFPNPEIQVTFEPIPLGDILIKNNDDKTVIIIERKSLSDLVSSIKDGRYEEQSYRLSHSDECCPHNIIYMIEGMFSILKTPQEKKMAISSILSLNYYKGFSVLRTTNIQETAELVLAFVNKIGRELSKGKQGFYSLPSREICDEIKETPVENVLTSSYSTVVKKVKKENLTPENIGEIILSQIPGISSITGIAIIKHFGSFIKTIDALKLEESKSEFENITYTTNGKTRRIGKTAYENMRKFLL
jgi:ERCC4-type nuclease